MFAVSLPRRSAALIAAYTIALQALLSAFAILPARADGLGWELCSSGAAESSGAPQSHDACGACLSGHCAPAAGAPPAVAYVLPLSQGTARAAFQPACAAVFVSTTTAASPLPEAVLTTLFDLTPAEARVLVTVGSGLSSAKSVEALGVSENTLKTHLSKIYAKTGTSRQADLVKLVADIGAPLRSAD